MTHVGVQWLTATGAAASAPDPLGQVKVTATFTPFKIGIPFLPFFSLLTSDRAQAVQDVAERRGASPAQVAIAWQLRRAPNVLPIPGTSNPEHVAENLAAVQIELSESQYAAIT